MTASDTRPGRRTRRPVVLSFRWYLLALTAAVMLPLLALAAVEAQDAIQARHTQVELEMRLLLAGGANSVEQGLDAITGTARLLAMSPSLAARDLAGFRQEADELAAARQVDVVLRDPSGAQVVATRVPRGAPPPTLPPEDRQARPALAANQAYVSDVYTSGMTHPFLTRLVVPARLGSGATVDGGYALEIAFTAKTVAGWVNSSGLPPQWFISVLGRNGQVVAHHPDPDRYVGRGTAADDFGRTDGLSGPWQGFDLDGQPLSGVYMRLASGWSVLVGAPDKLLAAPARTAQFWLAAAAVPLLLGGLISSLLLARRINRSVGSLERTARALGEGRAVTAERLPVRDMAFVQEALCRAGEDIAARRLTEQALLDDVQDGKDLLQAVVDGSGDLIFARDAADRMVLANQASAGLFGFASGEQAVGHRLDGSVPAAAALAATESGCIAAVEGRVFEVGHSALRNHAGAAIGTVSIARDVSERVAADTRLQRLQSDLARAGRLSAVAAMGAGLAHELHQPLSAAANFLAVAMRRLAGGVPHETGPVADAMAEASAQVLRTGEIVKRLRGFIGEAEMQQVALAPLVREAAEAAWQHAGPADARLHLYLDETLDALADPVSIQQVVSNLVRNAAEAVDGDGKGGGDVWVLLDPAADGSAMISVMDSGPGIDPRATERLFDVFGGSAKEGGLGVGLAICRTIVSAHGGWITAANHASGGAAFMFTLPPRPPTLAVAASQEAA